MSRILSSTLIVVLFASAALAATYPPAYRWRTITTEHFEIHFHDGEEDLARRTATMAEAIHGRVTSMLGHAPSGRTQLILTDHVDVSNGSATPFPYNRIELYVSAPGADPSSPLEFYDDWVNLVLTHEYAHIVHLDQARGISRGLRRVFGRTPISFPNQFAPGWMVEGIATLVESEATEAGRVKSAYTDMVLRTAAIEGRFASEPQASGLTARWPAGSARYLYGSEFLAWLARTRGLEQLAEYFRDYSGNLIPYRINASADAVYERSIRSLWREWSNEVQSESRAELERLESEGLTPHSQITRLAYETLHPALSPDGTRLAYTHRGPYEWPTIRVIDGPGAGATAGEDELAVLRVNTTSPLSWSPDGGSIAFSQLEYEGDFALLADLWIWNVGERSARRLTRGARLKSPAFTPDGGALIAVRNEAGRNQIVRVDARTGAVSPIFDPGDYRQFSEPRVSPDGRSFAVAEWQGGRVDIVLFGMDGSRIRNFTGSLPRSTSASPAFANDGSTLLFSSDVTGITNIYSVPLGGGAIERRTNVYSGAFFPAPAGDMDVVFANYSSEGFDLAHASLDRTFPIAAREIPASVTGSRTAADLSIPAPASTIDDRPYSPRETLRPTWWAPYISTLGSGDNREVTLGAYTSGADALGFHQYAAQAGIRTDGDHSTVDYGIAYAYDRLRPTITLSALGYSDYAALAVRQGGTLRSYRERIDRFLAQASFPVRRYRWQARGSIGAIHEYVRGDEGFDIADDQLGTVGLFSGSLTGVRAGLTFSNARQFGYGISPERGVTAALTAEALGGERSIQQVRTDLRGYVSVPVSRSPLGRHVLAARVAGGWTGGDFLLERELRVGGGGTEGLLSVDTRHFPVRGIPQSAVRGRNAALISLEYRLPLYEVDTGPATLPLFFHRISAGVFYDTATAWNSDPVVLPALTRPATDPFGSGNTVASAGAELALDLVLGFFVPLRYRVGGAYVIDAPACPAPGCDREGNVEFFASVGRSF